MDWFTTLLYLFVGAGYAGICTWLDLARIPETEESTTTEDGWIRFVLRTLFWPVEVLVRLLLLLVHIF